MKIVFSQTAPWNPRLTNPYRTRYATAAGRYFKVEADGLYTPWFISEITADGEWIVTGASGLAFNLNEARKAIENAVTTTTTEETP